MIGNKMAAQDPPAGQTQDKTESGSKQTTNIVAKLSQFADDHITIVRNISTGLAVAGLIILARSIKLVTKFGAASEIPVKFIEKNVSLRGKFHHVTENGIGVEHIPISVPVISRLVRQRPSNALLLIRLAGVELTEEGKTWLKHQLEPSEFLWFKLIGRQNDILDCLVSVNRGGVFSMSLNEEILRQGLGRTVPIDSLAHQYRLHWKVHRRLLRAEGKAEKKGKGLWKQQNLRERISAYLNDYKMLRLWKKLLKRIW